MIVLPTFNNYESIDLNENKIYKNTLGSSIKEIIGIGVSGKTKNEYNVIFKNYIKNFRFLNDYKSSFDKLLNDLILGANVIQSFEEFRLKKKTIEAIIAHMRASSQQMQLLSDKGMIYLKKKGYDQIFPNDYKAYTSDYSIRAFTSFSKLIEAIDGFYNAYLTSNCVDPWNLLSSSLPTIEENFEAIFNNLLSELSKIQDPREARKIVSEPTKYLWKDIFPTRNGDTDEGLKILDIGLGYHKEVYYRDINSLFTTIVPSLYQYSNAMSQLFTLYPNITNYYKPQFDSFEAFIKNHLDYILNTMEKLFPYYANTNYAKAIYKILCETKNLPKQHQDKIKSYEGFFNSVGVQVDKKIIQLQEEEKKKQKSILIKEQIEKYTKNLEKTKQNMEVAERLGYLSDYKIGRKELKKMVKILDNLEGEEAKNLKDAIKEELIRTKPIKKEVQIKKHILYSTNYDYLKDVIKDLDEAIEKIDFDLIKAYRSQIKVVLDNFEEKVNEFTGDVEQLKKSNLYIEIIKKANDSLNREVAGGKSEEAFKLEKNGISMMNSLLSTIDTYAQYPPSPYMITSVVTVKNNILNELNKMRKYIHESELIKKCVEDGDNKLKILDEYMAKCSSSPAPGK